MTSARSGAHAGRLLLCLCALLSTSLVAAAASTAATWSLSAGVQPGKLLVSPAGTAMFVGPVRGHEARTFVGTLRPDGRVLAQETQQWMDQPVMRADGAILYAANPQLDPSASMALGIWSSDGGQRFLASLGPYLFLSPSTGDTAWAAFGSMSATLVRASLQDGAIVQSYPNGSAALTRQMDPGRFDCRGPAVARVGLGGSYDRIHFTECPRRGMHHAMADLHVTTEDTVTEVPLPRVQLGEEPLSVAWMPDRTLWMVSVAGNTDGTLWHLDASGKTIERWTTRLDLGVRLGRDVQVGPDGALWGGAGALSSLRGQRDAIGVWRFTARSGLKVCWLRDHSGRLRTTDLTFAADGSAWVTMSAVRGGSPQYTDYRFAHVARSQLQRCVKPAAVSRR